jgi:uncharacterized protein (DUF1330 family)
MAAYLIVDIQIKDLAGFQAYSRGVPALVSKHGGEYLARGGPTEMLEGDWTPGRVVLIRFPDMAAAKAFLYDPEYQPLKSLRESAADSRMIAVEGV